MSTKIPKRPKLGERLLIFLLFGWLIAVLVISGALALASVFDGELWTRPAEDVDVIAVFAAGVVLVYIGYVVGALTAHSRARSVAEDEARDAAMAHEGEIARLQAARDEVIEKSDVVKEDLKEDLRFAKREASWSSAMHMLSFTIDALEEEDLPEHEIAQRFKKFDEGQRKALAVLSQLNELDPESFHANYDPLLSTLIALHREDVGGGVDRWLVKADESGWDLAEEDQAADPYEADENGTA